jgi:hypothetical protein
MSISADVSARQRECCLSGRNDWDGNNHRDSFMTECLALGGCFEMGSTSAKPVAIIDLTGHDGFGLETEQMMATEADFTAEEWKVILSSPALAGIAATQLNRVASGD